MGNVPDKASDMHIDLLPHFQQLVYIANLMTS